MSKKLTKSEINELRALGLTEPEIADSERPTSGRENYDGFNFNLKLELDQNMVISPFKIQEGEKGKIIAVASKWEAADGGLRIPVMIRTSGGAEITTSIKCNTGRDGNNPHLASILMQAGVHTSYSTIGAYQRALFEAFMDTKNAAPNIWCVACEFKGFIYWREIHYAEYVEALTAKLAEEENAKDEDAPLFSNKIK